jgi:membrane protein DedA with SNARE-associated domain
MQAFINLVQQFWIDLQQGQLRELGPWNYLLLALLIVWQGPIATLLGGAVLAGVTGNLTADILWYSVGRRGNVDRLFDNRYLKIYRGKVDTLKAAMEHHAPKFLLMAKLSFGLAVPTLVAAGLTRLRWRKWFPIVFIGETMFTGTLVIIGYFATEAIKRVEHGIQFFFVTISFIFILMVAWFIPRALRQDTTLGMSHYKEKSN